MADLQWVSDLFDALDTKNVDQFCSYFADDAAFILANSPAVRGRQNIYDVVQGFVDSIDASDHTLHHVYELPDGVLVRGDVKYTRLDGTTESVPYADVYELGAQGDIKVYQVYVENPSF